MTRDKHYDPDAARVLPRRDPVGDEPSRGRMTPARLTEIRLWIAAGHHNDRIVIEAVGRELLRQGAV